MTEFVRRWSDLRLKEGDKFIVSRRVSGVSDGDSTEIVLDNTDSDKLFYVAETLFKNNNGKAQVDATKNINVDAAGTSVTVEDMRVDGEETNAGVSAEFGGSYSGGTQFALDLVSGSTGGKYSESASTSGFVVAPGEAMRFTVTNDSGGPSDQMVRLVLVQELS